jgi:hypothetical protein
MQLKLQQTGEGAGESPPHSAKRAHPYRKAYRSRGINVAAPPLDSPCDGLVTYPGNIKTLIKSSKGRSEHVQRMDTNRTSKQTLQYKPKGRRYIGRPRKRWRDQFHFEDQGTGNNLILHEHDDDDDDDDDDSLMYELKKKDQKVPTFPR